MAKSVENPGRAGPLAEEDQRHVPQYVELRRMVGDDNAESAAKKHVEIISGVAADNRAVGSGRKFVTEKADRGAFRGALGKKVEKHPVTLNDFRPEAHLPQDLENNFLLVVIWINIERDLEWPLLLGLLQAKARHVPHAPCELPALPVDADMGGPVGCRAQITGEKDLGSNRGDDGLRRWDSMLFDSLERETSVAARRNDEKILGAMLSHMRGEFRESRLNIAVLEHKRSVYVTNKDDPIGRRHDQDARLGLGA
ncbi:MAG: hypothetical protein R3D62_00375 [Xanthobacteraceae bacterium]